MYKFLFCFLLACVSWSQKLHHQTISSQGVNVKITNGMIVSQSVGQVNTTVGNYKTPNVLIGQGYIQSFGIAQNTSIIKEAVSMIVYPNPIVDNANFKFSSDVGTTATFYLFDSRGRLIYNQPGELQQNNLKYDLSGIAEGVYFVKIETINHNFSTKIIKSK